MARRIEAVALLAQPELQSLGAAFDRAWPLDETPCLGALLQAIDEAEHKLWRERDARSTGLKEPRGPAL